MEQDTIAFHQQQLEENEREEKDFNPEDQIDEYNDIEGER